jgi:hypothetical protein
MSETNETVATATPAKTRTASVPYDVFSRIHRQVSDAKGSVQDVIDKVFAETGIKMNANNVQVKATNLRKEGALIGKLTSKSKKRRDLTSLNATLEAANKADESEQTEQAAGEQTAAS